MKVTVFGATGKTGRHVVEALVAKGHSVKALVRKPQALERPGVEFIQGSLNQESTVQAALQGADAVIFAAGPIPGEDPDFPRKAAELVVATMEAQGIKRVIWLLGAAVVDKRDAKDPIRPIIRGIMKLLAGRMLKASEQAFSIITTSKLDYTVLRPPMLGSPEPGKGLVASYNPPKPRPISRHDLGQFMADLVQGPLAQTWSRGCPFVEARE